MLNLDFYLSLFSPYFRSKPSFVALASAILSQVVEMIALIQQDFPQAFDLETATGIQLDMLGSLLNVPRPASDTSDDDYRFLLRARIAVHHWDGTNETFPAVLEAAFPDREASLIDNQDGSVTANLSGASPFPLADIFSCPAGVRLIEGDVES